ncbi:dentin sialophosphoprotein-like [Lucilia sericata]|uniref:dentin sialophosphoprotein-like n=1 Tax=Lucilia sericata TaxID=13632 RepID=UPI0018A804EA|nr:dentin sialophosphoprotein-like [Lucilia sericata]
MDSRRRRRSTRQRSRSRPLGNFEEPVNLMQLLRRRSRYRPYSVNNRNMRQVQHPFFMANNEIQSENIANFGSFYRRNINRLNEEILPSFNTAHSLNRQDMGTNTEVPCCAAHSSSTSTSTEQTPQAGGDVPEQMALNDTRSLIYEDLVELQNNSMPSFDSTVTNNIPSEATLEDNRSISYAVLGTTKSNHSKSQEESSSDATGSSVSYTEKDELVGETHLSDVTSKTDPQIKTDLVPTENNRAESSETNIANEPLDSFHSYSGNFRSLEANINRDYSYYFEDMERLDAYMLPDIFEPEESLLTENEVRTNETQNASTSEEFTVKDNTSESDNTSTKLIKRNESNTTVNIATDESSSAEDVKVINHTIEIPASSSDSLEVPTTIRIAHVEVHSNTSTENNASDSTLNIEDNDSNTAAADDEAGGDGLYNDSNNPSDSNLNNQQSESNTATVDIKAGGDGSHNDSLIQIEFTITANLQSDDDDDDTNADDEGEGNADNYREWHDEDT